MLLEINQPLDLDKTLDCAQGHRWREVEGHRGWYSSVLDGDPVWISQLNGPNGPLEFHTTVDPVAVEAKLRRQFRLDDNVEGIYTDLCSRNGTMVKLVERHCGLRVMRVNPWEGLVFFIAAANTTIGPTHARMDKVARRFWQKFQRNQSWQHNRYPFPGPEQVGSECGRDIWNEITFRYPAHRKYIYEAGQAVQIRNFDSTENMSPYGHSIEKLLVLQELLGVGKKTASCVALFGLGYLDAFPVDTNIEQAWVRWYGGGLSRDEMRKEAPKRFGPYAGYASQLLFADQLKHKQYPKKT